MFANSATSSSRALAVLPWACALTVFASAFLLFQVQPIIGKMLLPWFGGSPAVWTACLLFFQSMLLAGYAYAHLLAGIRGPRLQAGIHFLLAATVLLLLPITPAETWKPTGQENPTVMILLLLAATVGAPYLLLSATAPLVQHWYGRLLPGSSPYRLYALSNAASLIALLSYPVLVEPLLSSPVQGNAWSIGFAFYALLLGVMLSVVWRQLPAAMPASPPDGGTDAASGEEKRNKRRERKANKAAANKAAVGKSSGSAKTKPFGLPRGAKYAAWVLLPALASALLMAVTNHVCQDVAPVPLLWVVPLSLYLITFIISFDSPRWYLRTPLAMAGVLAVLSVSVDAGSFDRLLAQVGIISSIEDATQTIAGQATLYFAVLFVVAMLCHGELVRLKPPVERLTAFYLCVSAGGALGGLLVAVVCPLVFTTYYELPLALLLGFLLAVAVLFDDMRDSLNLGHWVLGAMVTLGGVYLIAWGQLINHDPEGVLARVRNFYGTLEVVEVREKMIGTESLSGSGGKPASGEEEPAPVEQWSHPSGRALYHGQILHGFQFLADDLRREPNTYYAHDSGVGLALDSLPAEQTRRVGVVGLGTGTLAAYGREGDFFCFYEINPAVVELAKKYFTYLDDTPATVEIVPGDARLSLEREPPRGFDVLALDAFSGDAVPAHLLTAEAFAVYRRHLAPQGIIAVHVSNRHLDLHPVVARSARRHGLEVRVVEVYHADAEKDEVADSDWMLVTADKSVFLRPALHIAGKTVPAYDRFPLWTDSYNSLWGILK